LRGSHHHAAASETADLAVVRVVYRADRSEEIVGVDAQLWVPQGSSTDEIHEARQERIVSRIEKMEGNAA
jgi:hypothetical protein